MGLPEARARTRRGGARSERRRNPLQINQFNVTQPTSVDWTECMQGLNMFRVQRRISCMLSTNDECRCELYICA